MIRFFRTMSRRDRIVLFGATAVLLLLSLWLTGTEWLFGSAVDWISQHSVLPDLFRQRFYRTGQLLPQFAPEIGAGENIYYFSYYGFLNPVILISYALPDISMVTYIQVAHAVLMIASVWLLYAWLRGAARIEQGRLSDGAIRLGVLLFALATPVLYHAHKQVMFVSYMPFLLAALIGTDRLLTKRRGGLLTAMVTLLFLVSYLHAVAAVIAVAVYGIYRRLSMTSTLNRKSFALDAARFAGCVCAGTARAGVLLLPTIRAVLGGRAAGEGAPVSLWRLLLPTMPVRECCYSGYGLGLTAIVLIAMIAIALRGNPPAQRFLAVTLALCTVLPVVRYVLNGFLYARGKSLIPFLPLAVLLIAFAYVRVENEDFPIRNVALFGLPALIVAAFVSAAFAGHMRETILLVADAALTTALIYAAMRRRQPLLLAVPTVCLALVVTAHYSRGDELVSREEANRLHASAKEELFATAVAGETGAFRTDDISSPKFAANRDNGEGYATTGFYASLYNKDYITLLYRDLAMPNPSVNDISFSPQGETLFQTLMGVRYLISEDGAPAGYRPAGSADGFTLWENDAAYSLAFQPSRTLSTSVYESLTPWERRIALLGCVVTEDGDTDISWLPQVVKTDISPDFGFAKTSDGHLLVKTGANATFTVPIPDFLDEYLYIVTTRLPKMRDHRTSITVNGVTNTLSGCGNARPNGNYDFVFAVSSTEPVRELRFTFPENAEFECEPFSVYKVALKDIRALRESVTMGTSVAFKDDAVNGRIEAAEAGTICFTLPYEESYAVYIDGKETAARRVDGAFLGCDIEAGKHNFRVEFRAPLRTAGIVVSLLGLVGWLGILWAGRRKKA